MIELIRETSAASAEKSIFRAAARGIGRGRSFFMEETTAFTWTYFVSQIKSIGILDVMDILVVTLLLYLVYTFIRDRRAEKLILGVGLLLLIMIISNLLGLSAMSFIMTNLFQVGFVALAVVFQPELRSVLEKVGGEPIRSLKSIGSAAKEQAGAVSTGINEIARTAEELSASRTGALIVLERTTKLGDIIKAGVTVNADLNNFLLRNIFYEGAPLHDGAVIIRDWRIAAAGCFLPLSHNENIIMDLGTRHRAGIGMSEESDAVVVIVSEETGNISVAVGGQLKRGFTYNSLKRELEMLFGVSNQKNISKIIPHIKKEQK